MPKKKNIVFSKRLLPPGAKRITKPGGERVWIINGMEFTSKRAYFVWDHNRRGTEKTQEKKPAEVKVCKCESPDPIKITPEWCATCSGKIMPAAEPKIPEFGTSIPFDPPLPTVDDTDTPIQSFNLPDIEDLQQVAVDDGLLDDVVQE